MAQDAEKFGVRCHGCLNHCRLVVVEDEYGLQVFGNRCRKGDPIGKEAYVAENGMPFTGRVRIPGRIFAVRVRSTGPVDPSDAGKIREFLRSFVPEFYAPGAVAVENVLGLGVDLVFDK